MNLGMNFTIQFNSEANQTQAIILMSLCFVFFYAQTQLKIINNDKTKNRLYIIKSH
jgi:hypothetical protein